MSEAHSAVDAAINDVDRLRRVLKRSKTSQVRSSEEKSLVKANCLAWFNNHRNVVRTAVDDDLLHDADTLYKKLLSASDRAGSRARYEQTLKDVRAQLSEIRVYAVTPTTSAQATTDAPPNFEPLVSDPAMQAVLERRWSECAKCVSAKAPLAATVMMGGLLEALLLARVHRAKDKARIVGSSAAPKDRGTGKALPLQYWTLRHYIDVAHELGWISSSARDVGEVVRDYRNYVHPHKELSHGIQLGDEDARLFWEISKGIARQVLKVAGA
jgi:hypothetical protein